MSSAKLTLLNVVRIARQFAEEAGWAFFRAHSINYDEKTRLWKVTAFLSAIGTDLMLFQIDDAKGEVVEYGPEKAERE